MLCVHRCFVAAPLLCLISHHLVPALTSRLMLGFMSICAFLSLWVQNTLAVTMVMPIVEAVLQQIVKDKQGGCVGEDNPNLQLEGDRCVLLEHVQKVYFPSNSEKGTNFRSSPSELHPESASFPPFSVNYHKK